MVTEPDMLVAGATLLHDQLARLDRAASRFRADSEIARVDGAGGHAVVVSPLLIEILQVALRAARATDGLVDPTVGYAMTQIGYERDFSEVPSTAAGQLPAPAPVPGWRSVEIDTATSTVRVPHGTRIDVGATAKAWAADRIAASVFDQLGCGALVSLGGDVAVAGPPPPGSFRVGLGDVCDAAPTGGVVAIASGGLATSGVAVRQWYVGDQLVHHIVDPGTGLPAAPWWRTVTVVASSCLEANTASTAAMVKGPSARAWLEARQLPARLVAIDGAVTRVAGWPEGELAGTGLGRPDS
jgi:thiamine biosynthesis lipoprotein